MKRACERYYDNVINLIEKAFFNNEIEQVSQLIATTIQEQHNIFFFGASHAGILTEEMFYRAGGNVVFNPVMHSALMLNTRPITNTTKMERLSGINDDNYGSMIFESHSIKKNDVVLIHSVSGRNAVTIDFALAAQKEGVKIIALTSLEYSKSVPSRHSCGKNLYQIADICLDNYGSVGDASVEIKNAEIKVSATSTVVGALLLQSINARVAEILSEKVSILPYFKSANIEGGDQYNEQVMALYKKHIFYI